MTTTPTPAKPSWLLPLVIAGSLFGMGLIAAIVIAVYCIGISNKDTGLRNQITAKQRDNQSQFDNMVKTISQSAQVTDMQAKVVANLARTAPEGSILTAVKEAIPNLDQRTYANLQNIVVAHRDGFTMRQTEILDLKRADDDLRTKFPSSLIVGGRPEIQVTIVTSDRADQAFQSGKDNDTSLTGK